MSRIEKGRRVSLIYREDGGDGRPTLVVDISGDDDLLPHEHREDARTALSEVLGVPLSEIPADMEVEVRRKPHGHPHSHWPEDRPKPSEAEKPTEQPAAPKPQGA